MHRQKVPGRDEAIIFPDEESHLSEISLRIWLQFGSPGGYSEAISLGRHQNVRHHPPKVRAIKYQQRHRVGEGKQNASYRGRVGWVYCSPLTLSE